MSSPVAFVSVGHGGVPTMPPSSPSQQQQLRGFGGSAAPSVEQAALSSSCLLQMAAGLAGVSAISAAVQRRRGGRNATARAAAVDANDIENPAVPRRDVAKGATLVALSSTVGAPEEANAEQDEVQAGWVQYDLNTGETLYDIDFDPKDPNHGFIVGARGLFYETKDGGKRWVSRTFASLAKGEEQIKYRFQNVSVNGDDIWIVGKPPLLLHSSNGGKGWKKVPLSKKLPGEPKLIVSLGEGKAEMATSSGAVYVTENEGRNWKSKVKETVDATLNRVSASGVQGASYFTGTVKSIKRDPNGNYIAVAQRGNFYLTFAPGNARWVPHNRSTARRIQAMGFRYADDDKKGDGVWMSLNGGLLQNCDDKGAYADLGSDTKDLFKQAKIKTGGIGIIDLTYRKGNEAWAVGGSGVIYYSMDGGKTWAFDKSGDDLPCNLYNVKFFNEGKVGYMIGSAGILLRKVFEA